MAQESSQDQGQRTQNPQSHVDKNVPTPQPVPRTAHAWAPPGHKFEAPIYEEDEQLTMRYPGKSDNAGTNNTQPQQTSAMPEGASPSQAIGLTSDTEKTMTLNEFLTSQSNSDDASSQQSTPEGVAPAQLVEQVEPALTPEPSPQTQPVAAEMAPGEVANEISAPTPAPDVAPPAEGQSEQTYPAHQQYPMAQGWQQTAPNTAGNSVFPGSPVQPYQPAQQFEQVPQTNWDSYQQTGWPQNPQNSQQTYPAQNGYGASEYSGPAFVPGPASAPPLATAPADAYDSQSTQIVPPAAFGPPQSPPNLAPEPPRERAAPTAEEFAARRAHKPQEPEATMGIRGLLRRATFGLVHPSMSKREHLQREAIAKVRRNFGGLRQVTVVNPKGGAGKTVAVLMTAMTFGQSRGGYVLAWDNNETQGTLGMRAQPDFHTHTVRDVLESLDSFIGPNGKVGDLTNYVRSQGEAMFDVLASDESATAGEMLTAQAFNQIREVVSRFYKLIIVDTGNNVRAENWQSSIDQTDQLIVTMSARGDSAETAARMLDHLEQSGRAELVRSAVTVVSMPPSHRGTDLPAIERHFSARTREVLIAPYDQLLDSGEPIRYEALTQATRGAWLKIAAAVAEVL